MTDRETPLVVLGLDGLSWSVMKPLLQDGRLPNFARLIRQGAIGRLDNGHQSYSPLIWNTIFSGRSPEAHGIRGFRKLRLRSGAEITDFLDMPPSLHSFYGLRHLTERVPSPGLWRMVSVGSTDRKAKMIWDVASEYGKRVAVVNPLTSVPVQPVRGQMIVYRDSADPAAAFPPELAGEWKQALDSSPTRRGSWRSYRNDLGALFERVRMEDQFALDLFEREPFALGVYYGRLADDASHLGWDFYGRDRLVLTALPNRLNNDAWEQLVSRHIDDPVFTSYQELDALLGRFQERLAPNFVIVSDHGWSYSGCEHYGSQDGIVILAGPAFRRTDLEGVSIQDVAPTVLAAFGIPLSRELKGRPLAEAFRAAPEPKWVAAYGPPRHSRKGRAEIDEEELQRLKALGYVQ
jgi:hypothetical protein